MNDIAKAFLGQIMQTNSKCLSSSVDVMTKKKVIILVFLIMNQYFKRNFIAICFHSVYKFTN